MAANSSFVKLSGFKELAAALEKMPAELAKIAEASALRGGMTPVRTAARRNAKSSRDTGLLEKSIGLNVRKTRKKTPTSNLYTARVGAQSGHRKEVTRLKKTLQPDGTYRVRYVKEMANPANYAHLVEFGTSHSAAKPFIRPAVNSSEAAIMAGLQKGYAKGMEKVSKKIRGITRRAKK